MATYNIIGDIAGRLDELMLLLTKMPKANKIILLGDMIDRGPNSKEVIEWAMTNPDVIAIKGNHEDMMVDFYLKRNRYEQGIWFDNGGSATVQSYGCMLHTSKPSYEDKIRESLNKDHIEWMDKLPMFYEDAGLYVSHAPWNGSFALGKYKSAEDMLWNRYPPHKHEGILQVFGHNASLKAYHDYAICIDNSSKRVLTGMHWPTKEIIEQEYLNEIKDGAIREHKAPEDR
jgi:serine/threonine protein phosphatase 1